MVAEPVAPFTPRSSFLLIQRARPVAESRGIHLPEVSRRVPSQGVVLSVGPGRRIEGTDLHTVIWPVPGDEVLFPAADYQQCGADEWQGLVRAESVIGVIHPDSGEVAPENAWVKIEPDAAETESAGGILLPEKSRKRARSGVILDAGPGETRTKGPLIGTRVDTRCIMGLTEGEPLAGRTVYWEATAKVVHLGGQHRCVFVKAEDLMLISDEGEQP